MTQHNSILPDGWKRPPGFSHAVLSTPVNLTIAGQFGWDPKTQTCVSTEFGDQWEQALRNLKTVVEAAGGEVTDIVNLRVFVLDMEEYQSSLPKVGSAWGEILGKHFPGITLIEVAAFTDPDARVEIEALAAVPGGATA